MGLVHSQSFVTVTSVQFQTMLIPRTLSSHSPTPAPAPANHRSAVLDVAHEQCLGSAGGGGVRLQQEAVGSALGGSQTGETAGFRGLGWCDLSHPQLASRGPHGRGSPRRVGGCVGLG